MPFCDNIPKLKPRSPSLDSEQSLQPLWAFQTAPTNVNGSFGVLPDTLTCQASQPLQRNSDVPEGLPKVTVASQWIVRSTSNFL